MSRAFRWALLTMLPAGFAIAQDATLPDGEGRKQFEEVCTECHELETVTSQRQTTDEWRRTIMKMEARGAEAPDGDFNKIVAYLAKNFRPERVNVNKATAVEISAALGITPDESRALVKYRQSAKAFRNWDDIKKVPGLDMKRLEARKDLLLF